MLQAYPAHKFQAKRNYWHCTSCFDRVAYWFLLVVFVNKLAFWMNLLNDQVSRFVHVHWLFISYLAFWSMWQISCLQRRKKYYCRLKWSTERKKHLMTDRRRGSILLLVSQSCSLQIERRLKNYICVKLTIKIIFWQHWKSSFIWFWLTNNAFFHLAPMQSVQ